MENLHTDDGTQKDEKKNSPARELFGWIVYIGIIILLTWFIITFIGVRTKVSGRSMETTLQDGNQLIVDKISYRFTDPKRYDIVVFPYKYEENTHYIKRIIGLPGETIQVKDGYAYINGKLLESDIYGAELMNYPGIAESPITLADNEYFVLGDNRNHSADSREPNVGIIKRKDLTGKAWIRIYPFDEFGVIKHE